MKSKEIVEEQKKALELEFEYYKKKHELKMQQLAYERETNKIFHERELERIRIRTHEINRSQLLREQINQNQRRR